MSLFSRVCCVATIFAAMTVSTTFAQPPGRGERGDGERGRGGERSGDRGPGGPEGRRGGPPPEQMMRMFPVLAALDADQDGKISKNEIENATAALKKLDKNGDGELSGEEMRPNFAAFGQRGGPDGGPGGGRGFGPPEGRGQEGRPEGRGGPEGRGDPGAFLARMFDDRDANKDGKLSKEELPEQMAARMEQIDTDQDGSVSRKEMEAMMSRMRDRGGRAGQDGRGRPEGDGQPGGDRPRRPEAE